LRGVDAGTVPAKKIVDGHATCVTVKPPRSIMDLLAMPMPKLH
jgi:hypothetical protein